MSTDKKRNYVSENRTITQADILKQLYSCIPDKLAYEKVSFFPDCPWIRIKNHLYVYYFTNERVVFCERKRHAGKEYDVLLSPNMKKQKNKVLKSKSGVVKQGKKVLFVVGAALTLAMAYKGYHGITLPDSAISTSVDDLEEEGTLVLEEPEILIIPETTSVIEETFEEEIFESESAVLPTIKTFDLYVTPTDSEGFAKRERTVEKFGAKIDYYATRYGMSCDFLIDQFSQERPNDFDNVSEEKKS